MFKSKSIVASVAALTVLAACGGSGGSAPLTEFEAFEGRVETAIDMAERLEDTPGTKFSAMPDSGSARFNGFAEIFVDPVISKDNDDISMVGDVSMRVNFGNERITGKIDNIEFAKNIRPTSADITQLGGEIVIGERRSNIGNDVTVSPRADNRWTADYRGNIQTPDGKIRFDGDLDGQFLGTRVGDDKFPIKGLYGEDEGSVMVGNRDADFYIGIVAEN